MSMDEAQAAARFKAIKKRLTEGGDEFAKYAPQDMAWLVVELTGAANALRRLEMELQAAKSDQSARQRYLIEREQFRESRKLWNKQYGEMSAKIGQARAETALARERLRAVTKKLHEERRT